MLSLHGEAYKLNIFFMRAALLIFYTIQPDYVKIAIKILAIRPYLEATVDDEHGDRCMKIVKCFLPSYKQERDYYRN